MSERKPGDILNIGLEVGGRLLWMCDTTAQEVATLPETTTWHVAPAIADDAKPVMDGWWPVTMIRFERIDGGELEAKGYESDWAKDSADAPDVMVCNPLLERFAYYNGTTGELRD